MGQQRYRLTLSKLKFCSLVDDPAQPNAKTLLIKRNNKRVSNGVRGDSMEGVATLAKLNEELGLAFFWAFTCTNEDGTPHFDLQGDAIDADFIKAAMDFMVDGGGAVDEMHDEEPTEGRVVFAFPMTPDIAKAFGIVTKQTGLMIAIKPTTDQLAKLKDGTYSGVSIGGLGVREAVKSKPGRVLKATLYTTETDGHQHQLNCYEDGTFWLSYATSEGADNSHSHAVVYEGGKLVILADSGHTHELAEGQPGVAVVPADAVVIVAARAPHASTRNASATKSTNTIAPGSVNPQVKETAVDKDQIIADLTKRLEGAERIAKMSGAHKAHYDTLKGEAAEAFLAKSEIERNQAIETIEKSDPVEFTLDGVSYRKSTQGYALAKRLLAEVEKNDNAEIAKAATENLGNMPGESDVHAAIVKAVRRSGESAEMQTKMLATLKGANAIVKGREKAPGGDGADAVDSASSPLEALTKGLVEFCKTQKIDERSMWTVGLPKFEQTDAGRALKSAYDESVA